MATKSKNRYGELALVGGAEWREGCSFDETLLSESGQDVVTVLPTASAYEYPDRAVKWAEDYFRKIGGKVEGLMLLNRTDAHDPDIVSKLRSAKFIYLSGGSPMHLRSVLKDSPALEALKEAWHGGSTLAGSSAGAMVLTDPMSDPRGGALTVGLGLLRNVAFVPHFDTWDREKEMRTFAIAERGGVVVAGVDERTALIRSGDGTWRVEGVGTVKLVHSGTYLELSQLESYITYQP